jgi:hypothetical protein
LPHLIFYLFSLILPSALSLCVRIQICHIRNVRSLWVPANTRGSET